VIFKVYHSNTGTSNSTSPGDSDTELTSTEPITSKKTPPDSTSDEPTSPPNKTTHRQQQQQQQHAHRGRPATDPTPQSGGQGPSTN
jgi:hypothetical protein